MANTESYNWGIACPHCGDADQINVAATVWVRLEEDGTDIDAPSDGSHEWDGNSACQCEACGHSGYVHQFKEGPTV